MTVFQEIITGRVNTTEPNQMILVSFFSKDKFTYAIFFSIKVMKIERSTFLGTPSIPVRSRRALMFYMYKVYGLKAFLVLKDFEQCPALLVLIHQNL